MSEIASKSTADTAPGQHRTLIALVIIFMAIRVSIDLARIQLRGTHVIQALLQWLVLAIGRLRSRATTD